MAPGMAGGQLLFGTFHRRPRMTEIRPKKNGACVQVAGFPGGLRARHMFAVPSVFLVPLGLGPAPRGGRPARFFRHCPSHAAVGSGQCRYKTGDESAPTFAAVAFEPFFLRWCPGAFSFLALFAFVLVWPRSPAAAHCRSLPPTVRPPPFSGRHPRCCSRCGVPPPI